MRKTGGPGLCQKCGVERISRHRDHITPRYKGIELGWTPEQIEAPENIQYICANCHEDKTRQDLKGRKNSPEARAKMRGPRLHMRGIPMPEAQKEKLRGRFRSPETRARIRVVQARVWTPELRAAHSAKFTGRRHGPDHYSPEALANLQRMARERNASPEMKAAIGRAADERWALKQLIFSAMVLKSLELKEAA